MTTIDTNKFKVLLEEERAKLEEDLRAHGKNIDGNWQGSAATEQSDTADPNVVADSIEELVVNVPLVEELEVRYNNVLAALEKIENGTYGVCEESGEPIPVERLEANPAARTRTEHAK